MKYLKYIQSLLSRAEESTRKGEYELARQYVKIIVKISARKRFKLPLLIKRKYCRRCLIPLIPGITERRRIRKKILIRSCLLCGWIRRYDLRNERFNKKSQS